MEKDIRVFENITADQLRMILIFGELVWLLIAALAYYFYPESFIVYAPMLLVFNVLSMLPFPGIMRKAKNEYKEEVLHYAGASENDEVDSDTEKLGVRERTCIGFYCVSNAFLIIFVGFWMILTEPI